MKQAELLKLEESTEQGLEQITDVSSESFANIAPFWPLQNLVAVNPLQGFENIPFLQALHNASAYFEQNNLPSPMLAVNRETIKWLQAFFDQGQATIMMPQKERGLYKAWLKLAIYDKHLHQNNKQKMLWLKSLPKEPELASKECLLRLGIAKDEQVHFVTLLLTTLAGWASYIKYCTSWANNNYAVSQKDYVAMRLIITCLLYPQAKQLLDWHKHALQRTDSTSMVLNIESVEKQYRLPLLAKISQQKLQEQCSAEAQLVFCIDVRSEPLRAALEKIGNYQTYGFAGFFGVPVQITNAVTKDSYASCPVLLKPKHVVQETPCKQDLANYMASHKRQTGLKSLYQSLKYNFTTPFALVEGLGLFSGVWMALKSLTPKFAARVKAKIDAQLFNYSNLTPCLDNMSLKEQCAYAKTMLRMIGLTQNFAPLVVLCGHGSATNNNAYASALDCGACGGRHGASNAKILAAILNSAEVRHELISAGIIIPEHTRFIAAEHNTTSDAVTLFATEALPGVERLQSNLELAKQHTSLTRVKTLHHKVNNAEDAANHTLLRTQDWAQVRPEWGLARNAAFIVGPRDITAQIDLQGRCFLHSYNYHEDKDATLLTTILTAPMVVAQWINSQYLFSTINNVAYGGGSKVTKNITGKIGVMQGNASDLMTGLPLQSVYASDTKEYHEPQRLMTVVFAPRNLVDKIITEQQILQKLFSNEWVQLVCIEPQTREIYWLKNDLTWVLQ